MVAIAPGGGAHGFQIAARTRLGHGDGADQLARGHARQPAVFLLGVAIGVKVGCHHVRVQRKAQAAGACARNLFEQHGRVAKVAPAAVGLGQQRVEQALAARLEPDFLGYLAVTLPLGMKGHDLLVEKAPYLLTELLMVFTIDGALGQFLHGVQTLIK